MPLNRDDIAPFIFCGVVLTGFAGLMYWCYKQPPTPAAEIAAKRQEFFQESLHYEKDDRSGLCFIVSSGYYAAPFVVIDCKFYEAAKAKEQK